MKTVIALLTLLLALPVALGETREWKTADGSKTLVAEYVRSGDGKVTILRKRDRKSFTIALDTLSEEDQVWVKKKEEEGPASEEGEGKEADAEFAKLITGDWERTEGHNLKYRIYGERKLRRSKGEGYPLVVYLHGMGGDVMSSPEPWSANSFTKASNYRKRPCFVIAPQNPDQKGWNGSKADSVIEIVEEMIKKLPVDPKRIYLTGYSMGGYGTFHLLAQEPKLFSAGIPVAGGGNPGAVRDYKKVALWVFHGAKDPVVPVSQSQAMVEALKKARSEVKYTEFPDADHGIAGNVYNDEKVHEWLFEQSQ
ncbi:MAG: prolyl oligopeptidase family serine peptidase [Roseibacillus sp.]